MQEVEASKKCACKKKIRRAGRELSGWKEFAPQTLSIVMIQSDILPA
jgi:hypothetical protein